MITGTQRAMLLKLINAKEYEKIKVGKSVKDMMSDLGLNIIGDKICLSTREKQKIIRYIREHHGEDLEKKPQTTDRSRLSRSTLAPNEKRGGYAVFGSMLNFSGNTCLWFKDGTSVGLNTNAILSCDLNTIDISKISSLSVVENGDTIIHAKILPEILPLSYKNSLIVFRGYGENIVLVHNLVKMLSEDCTLGYFFDYDPSGLKMMIAEGKKRDSALLLPKTLPKEVIKLNKKETFNIQYNDLQPLYAQRQNFSQRLREHIENIKDNEYAITQENLVAHRVLLEEVFLTDN